MARSHTLLNRSLHYGASPVPTVAVRVARSYRVCLDDMVVPPSLASHTCIRHCKADGRVVPFVKRKEEREKNCALVMA